MKTLKLIISLFISLGLFFTFQSSASAKGFHIAKTHAYKSHTSHSYKSPVSLKRSVKPLHVSKLKSYKHITIHPVKLSTSHKTATKHTLIKHVSYKPHKASSHVKKYHVATKHKSKLLL